MNNSYFDRCVRVRDRYEMSIFSKYVHDHQDNIFVIRQNPEICPAKHPEEWVEVAQDLGAWLPHTFAFFDPLLLLVR